jgi:hypothetical protein
MGNVWHKACVCVIGLETDFVTNHNVTCQMYPTTEPSACRALESAGVEWGCIWKLWAVENDRIF